jgi:hypothetical protein
MVVDNPLSLLKREADSIRNVIAKIDGDVETLNAQITELMVQKASLNLVATALDNEMDRIRLSPQQLELDLEVE